MVKENFKEEVRYECESEFIETERKLVMGMEDFRRLEEIRINGKEGVNKIRVLRLS